MASKASRACRGRQARTTHQDSNALPSYALIASPAWTPAPLQRITRTEPWSDRCCAASPDPQHLAPANSRRHAPQQCGRQSRPVWQGCPASHCSGPGCTQRAIVCLAVTQESNQGQQGTGPCTRHTKPVFVHAANEHAETLRLHALLQRGVKYRFGRQARGPSPCWA